MKRSVDPSASAHQSRRIELGRFREGELVTTTDLVAVEEPLEIRVVVETAGRRRTQSIAVTMRTPGGDAELASGFLVSEGVVRARSDIWKIEHCRDAEAEHGDNTIDVHLAPGVTADLTQLSRSVLTSSACGICGRASIESVQQICDRLPASGIRLAPSMLRSLTSSLADAQPVFSTTGGLHAAALFDARGELLLVREDVGRHNAFDKVVGALLAADRLPAAERLVMVSGRASFELVQKALLAGIPVLIAVGAPSSLAVDLARSYGMTLIGFFRPRRFNVYCGPERLDSD